MGQRVFEDGAIVRIDGVNGTREIKNGRADSDNEVQVWNRQKTDYSYYDVRIVHLAEPLTAAQCGTNQVTEGTATMADKVSRSVVRVHLVDEDKGLDVSKALVADFGTHIMEGSREELIQEILMDSDANVQSKIRAHNAVRAKEVDLDIRQRTGNEVKLQEVKLKDLTWKVTAA